LWQAPYNVQAIVELRLEMLEWTAKHKSDELVIGE
jgi:hypothetical protein